MMSTSVANVLVRSNKSKNSGIDSIIATTGATKAEKFVLNDSSTTKKNLSSSATHNKKMFINKSSEDFPPTLPFPSSLAFEPDEDEESSNKEDTTISKEVEPSSPKSTTCEVISKAIPEHEKELLRKKVSKSAWVGLNMKHSVAGRMLHKSHMFNSRASGEDHEGFNKFHRSEPIRFTYHGDGRSSIGGENHGSLTSSLGFFASRNRQHDLDEEKGCSDTRTFPNFQTYSTASMTKFQKQNQNSTNDDRLFSSLDFDSFNEGPDNSLEEALRVTRQHNLARNSPCGPSNRRIIYTTTGSTRHTPLHSASTSRRRYVART